jgi:hypothetical protein
VAYSPCQRDVTIILADILQGETIIAFFAPWVSFLREVFAITFSQGMRSVCANRAAPFRPRNGTLNGVTENSR